MFLEIILFAAIIGFLLYQTTVVPKGMPPGSYGLPVLGTLPSPAVHITEHFSRLKNKYGNIFTTKWGSRPIVVLAEESIIKKTLNHPDLQHRTDFFSFELIKDNLNVGIVSSMDKVWSVNRKFLLHHLRDLGMGKSRLEVSIQDEAAMLVRYLEENSLGTPTELDYSINVAVLNVIWQMLASERYEADDTVIRNYNRMVTENFDILQGNAFIFDIMPWLVKIIPTVIINKITRVDVMMKNRDIVYVTFRNIIAEHQKTLDPENPRDVIDYYLLEMEAAKDDPETTFRADHLDLLCLMSDMFAAGSETTSTTLRTLMMHLAINQEVLKKAQDTLDNVVPRDRLPSLEDRPQLAYIDAVILDVLRLSSLLPMGVPHYASANIAIEGYIIPKNTIVMPCLELCHKDPALWEKPEDLHPDHFLDDQGKLDSKREGFMPFSLGRRQCLGESLARMELFLFASAIIQRFTIVPPPGVTLDTKCDPTKKIFNSPKPFKVILNKRI